MTQEEFLKAYKGKCIEISTTEDEETVWMFNVKKADFSQGNGSFIGWISADKSIFGTPGKVEVYADADDDMLVLRPHDKITVYESKEKLDERIVEYLKSKVL